MPFDCFAAIILENHCVRLGQILVQDSLSFQVEFQFLLVQDIISSLFALQFADLLSGCVVWNINLNPFWLVLGEVDLLHVSQGHGHVLAIAIDLLNVLLNCILHHSVGDSLLELPTALRVELELPLLRGGAIAPGLA